MPVLYSAVHVPQSPPALWSHWPTAQRCHPLAAPSGDKRPRAETQSDGGIGGKASVREMVAHRITDCTSCRLGHPANGVTDWTKAEVLMTPLHPQCLSAWRCWDLKVTTSSLPNLHGDKQEAQYGQYTRNKAAGGSDEGLSLSSWQHWFYSQIYCSSFACCRRYGAKGELAWGQAWSHWDSGSVLGTVIWLHLPLQRQTNALLGAWGSGGHPGQGSWGEATACGDSGQEELQVWGNVLVHNACPSRLRLKSSSACSKWASFKMTDKHFCFPSALGMEETPPQHSQLERGLPLCAQGPGRLPGRGLSAQSSEPSPVTPHPPPKWLHCLLPYSINTPSSARGATHKRKGLYGARSSI